MRERAIWRRYLRFLGSDPAADVEDELDFHFAMRVEELMRRGLTMAEARDRAEREFGDLEGIRREMNEIGRIRVRRENRARIWESLGKDLHLAARTLRKSPTFTAVVVSMLALGIGATTGMYALVDTILLRPLSYRDAERLVSIDHPVAGLRGATAWDLSPAEYFHYLEHNRSFDAIGVYHPAAYPVVFADRAERVESALASASLFSVLRARPALGRLLVPEDNRPGAPLVVVLGYDLWQTRFAGSTAVLGTTLRIEGAPVEVVGVAPEGFQLPDEQVDLWLPMPLDPSAAPIPWHELKAVARLRAGVSPTVARADLSRLTRQLPQVFPAVYSPSFMRETQFGIAVRPLREQVIGAVGRTLWILLAAGGLVLLVACANAANLVLIRAEARRRELAIRSALGAGRRHLVRYHLAEGLLIALLACALALALAYSGIRLLLAFPPAGIPRLSEVHLGGAAIVVAVLMSIATGVGLGLLPVVRNGTDFSPLRAGGHRSTSTRRQNAVRDLLVIGQVALALVLVTAAGLLLQTFRNIGEVPPGFNPAGVLTMELSVPVARYSTFEEIGAFYRELTTRIEALPGVQSAGATTSLPLRANGECSPIFVEDHTPTSGEEPPCVRAVMVAPGYFRSLGIPVRGRTPDWADLERRTGAVVVSRALADRLWPGESPLGKGIRGHGWGRPFYHVVGIASDVRAERLDRPPVSSVYFPLLPLKGAPLWDPRAMTLTVRAETERPEELTSAIRRTLTELDPEIPLANVQTMERVVARSKARTSFAVLLLSAAAGLALLLAAVGLYGLIAYGVGQRKHEIGIRIALGARATGVLWLVIRQGLALAILGIGAGLVGAFAGTRLLSSLLYGVGATDPLVFGAVPLLLVVVALLSTYLPARRATRVDPIIALSAE